VQTVVRKCTPSASCLSSPDDPDDPDDPATYSVSELSVRCVNEMCQCAVSVRNGCAETAGGNQSTGAEMWESDFWVQN
jgi:hypothetical protein